jgi:hypothetical protein
MSKQKKLTKKDYERVAATLHGTHANVYFLARSMFGEGFQWTDAHFDALEKATGLFRCEQCSEWKDKDEKDRAIRGFCTPCVDEMNGESDDPEED